jgi:hypothetical protein
VMKLIVVASLIVLAVMMSGCGATSSPTNPQNMQLGQWEFAVTSTNGSPVVYVETDLSNGGGTTGIGSYINATAVFWNQTGGSIAGLYNYCLGTQTTFSVTGNNVTALVFVGSTQLAQATATLSSDGKSMQGTYQLSGTATAVCSTPLSATGTFTGQFVAPLNGTYKGSLSDGSALMLQVTQDSNFGITASGTATLNGTTTNLTITPNSGPSSLNNVIGATVSSPSGVATNVNGTGTFQVFGHFTPDASKVSFVINNGAWSTGTLTKQ